MTVLDYKYLVRPDYVTVDSQGAPIELFCPGCGNQLGGYALTGEMVETPNGMVPISAFRYLPGAASAMIYMKLEGGPHSWKHNIMLHEKFLDRVTRMEPEERKSVARELYQAALEELEEKGKVPPSMYTREPVDVVSEKDSEKIDKQMKLDYEVAKKNRIEAQNAALDLEKERRKEMQAVGEA